MSLTVPAQGEFHCCRQSGVSTLKKVRRDLQEEVGGWDGPFPSVTISWDGIFLLFLEIEYVECTFLGGFGWKGWHLNMIITSYVSQNHWIFWKKMEENMELEFNTCIRVLKKLRKCEDSHLSTTFNYPAVDIDILLLNTMKPCSHMTFRHNDLTKISDVDGQTALISSCFKMH